MGPRYSRAEGGVTVTQHPASLKAEGRASPFPSSLFGLYAICIQSLNGSCLKKR